MDDIPRLVCFSLTRLLLSVLCVAAPVAAKSPTTTIEWPKANATEQGDFNIEGTASAPPGVRSVELIIHDIDRDQFWNGNDWQPSKVRLGIGVLPRSGKSVRWSTPVPATRLQPGRYRARAWAFSEAGNGDPLGNAKVSFRWDDRPQAVDGFSVQTIDATTAEVNWTPDPDARRVSYDVYLDDLWIDWIDDPDAQRYRFAGLTPGEHELGISAIGSSDYPYASARDSHRREVVVSSEMPTAPEERTLVYADEFDTLDTDDWKPEFSTYGDGNDELQCYMPEQVSVQKGKLVLLAEQRSAQCPGDERTVASGMVRSQGFEFSPGQYIEYRVKLTPNDPTRQGGLWPAVWASGWAGEGSYGGEWDGLEVMTAIDPKRFVHNVFYERPDGKLGSQPRKAFLSENFSDRWHTIGFHYGLNGQLKWYKDGTLEHTVDQAETSDGWPAPFDQGIPEIKINLAVGGTPGPLQDTAVPATFEIDYVRIYDRY